jgi:hypothetical protein
MNSTDCPAGYARDQAVLLPFQQSEECTVPLALFICILSLTVIGKCTSAILMFRAWMQRRRRIFASNDQRKIALEKGRKPIVPGVLAVASLFYFLGLITFSLNIFNMGNGMTYWLYGIGYGLCHLVTGMYHFKIITFGMLLGGPAMKHAIVNMPYHQKAVTAMNRFQRIVFGLQTLALLGQCIVFIILVPISPTEIDQIRAGFAFQSIANMSQGLGIAYYLQRVLAIIKKSRAEQTSLQMRSIVRSFRGRQLFVLLCTIPITVLAALHAALIVPTYWYLLLVHMWSDIIANFAFALTSFPNSSKNRRLQPNEQVTPMSPALELNNINGDVLDNEAATSVKVPKVEKVTSILAVLTRSVQAELLDDESFAEAIS